MSAAAQTPTTVETGCRRTWEVSPPSCPSGTCGCSTPTSPGYFLWHSLLFYYICLLPFFTFVSPVLSYLYICPCAHADGSLTTADGQTAGRDVRHAWTAQLLCPGCHGDETRPQRAPLGLLRWLLACYKRECFIKHQFLNHILWNVVFDEKGVLFWKLPAFVCLSLFSPRPQNHQNMFPSAVRSAMLQVVFDRADLSNTSTVSDAAVMLWLHNRMSPLLVDLSPNHVVPFFRILAGRNCSIEQQGWGVF